MYRAGMQLFLAFTILALTSGAQAQYPEDDFPRVPRRIGMSEFYNYVDRLHLSEAQQLEADRAYDDYLADFAPLRAEITAMLAEHPAGHWGIVESDGIIAHLPALCDRVKALDDTLFERLSALRDDGDSDLMRVRWSRERSMLMSLEIVEVFVGGGVPCLTDLFATLEPPANVMELVDPLLLTYEQRLTELTRTLFHAAVDNCTNPDDASADRLIDTVRAMRALNRKTFTAIRKQLSHDLANRWYDTFYRYTYPPAWSAAHSWLLVFIETALAESELTAGEREQLAQKRNELIAQRNEYVEELAAMLDQSAIRRAERNDRLSNRTYMNRSNEIQREFGGSHYRTRRQLEEMLGERAPQDLQPNHNHYDSTNRRRCDIVTHTYHIAPFLERRKTRFWSNDEIVARPLTPGEFDACLVILGVDGDETSELASDLYLTYRDDLDAAAREKMRELMETRMRFPREFAGTERWDKIEAMRAEIRAYVADADKQLFTDLLAIADATEDDAPAQRIRAMRHRSFWRFTRMVIRDGVVPNQASNVDIVVLLAHFSPESVASETIRPLLDEYDEKMHELVDARWAAFMEREEHFEARTRSEILLDLQIAAREAHHALAVQNHETAQRIADSLGRDLGSAFFDHFARSAYPEAFIDPSNMDTALQQGLSLDDLQPSQRDALLDLQSQYHEGVDHVRRRMVELCAAQVPDFQMSGSVMEQDRITAEEQYSARMLELRDELATVNRAALRGMRSTLSRTQLRSVSFPDLR